MRKIPMRREVVKLYEPQEYKGRSGNFIPNLNAYLHEDHKSRPAIIVVPGGGYQFVSHSEAYIVAMRYYKEGYQVYVLTYTINTLGLFAPIEKQPLKDISRAICEVRKREKINQINIDQVAIVGFSAGGHLTASLGVHYNHEIKDVKDFGINNRPDAIILCYPVVSAREYRHEGSIKALYGMCPTEEQLKFASVDENINSDTPPTFLWHTVTDEVVPIENSILFMNGCMKAKVPIEAHFYPTGQHGLSTADEEWQRNEMGDSSYTYEQIREDSYLLTAKQQEAIPEEYRIENELSLDEFAKRYNQIRTERKEKSNFNIPTYDPSVREWLAQSVEFLEKVWKKLI